MASRSQTTMPMRCLQSSNYSKHIFFDKKREWNQIVDRGMANDFSWNASKFKYEGLYNYLIGE